MNTRTYSREGLLKNYQNEANDLRDRKLQEKQNRVIEERKALELINRELEQEKRNAQNLKMKRTNDRMEDYNQMIQNKSVQQDLNKINQNNKKDYKGTFKIGGENREIKRKTYDELNNELVLNPMRENLNSNERGRFEVTQEKNRYQQRGKSNGFNIINHSNVDNSGNENQSRNYNNNNYNNNMNELNNRNANMRNNTNNYNLTDYNNNVQQNSNINSGIKNQNSQFNPQINNYPQDIGYYQKQPEGIENLENFPYEKEKGELYGDNNAPNEFDDPEFQKYYEEFMRQKMLEEEMAAREKNPNIMNNSNNVNNNIPTSLKEYESYKNQNQHLQRMNEIPNQNQNVHAINNYNNQGNSVNENINELDQNFNNLNLNNEQSREYLNNKQRNQNGYGFNHISHIKENQNIVNKNPIREDIMENNSRKMEQQDQYRHYLDSQVKEKSNQSDLNLNNIAPRSKLIKKDTQVSSNPYSTKNYDFAGKSNISNNPITNPVNSYQFNYDKFKQQPINPLQRETGSARIRGVGNNTMN